MEPNNSKEKTYEVFSKTYITMDDIRMKNENQRLTLRKKHKIDRGYSYIRNKINLMNETHYRIYLNKLKTNNDNIRNFYIDLDRPEYTMNNLVYLLGSMNDDEVKFGLYALKKFFLDILNQRLNEEPENENQINVNNDDVNVNNSIILHPLNNQQININGEKKIQLYKVNNNQSGSTSDEIMGLFLKRNIINNLFKIMKTGEDRNVKSDQINIDEILGILINMTTLDLSDKDIYYNFYNHFIQEDNLSLLISLIDQDKFPLELIYNTLCLFSNIIYIFTDAKQIFINSSLTSSLYDYLTNRIKFNTEVAYKVLKVIYLLYKDNQTNLDIEACKILFKIYKISLTSYRDKEVDKFGLEIMGMLSKIDIKELTECFNDHGLINILIIISIGQPLQQNELNVGLVLNIFYNIIEMNNKEIMENFVFTGVFITFYNKLLMKYRTEKVNPDFRAEENMIISLNNIIYHNYDHSITYIFGEGEEILNFFLTSICSSSPHIRVLGTKSFMNMFAHLKIKINKEIIFNIVNNLVNSLIFGYIDCYYNCIQCLFMIMKLYDDKTFNNELKVELLKKGTLELMEKIRIQIMYDSKSNKLEKDDEEMFNDFVDEIESFLKDDF